MDSNPATHAAHDELLLARLFGDDLDGRDVERAREMTASCPECAAVLADFAAIAAATVALPVPSRPRDFTIGPADAHASRARRGTMRPGGLRAALGGLGPVRSLGASMTAAGVVGILAIGALSAIGQSGPGDGWFRVADAPAAEVDSGGSYSSAQPANGQGGKAGDSASSPSGYTALGGPSGSPEAQQSVAVPDAGGSARAPEQTNGEPAGSISSDGHDGPPPPSPSGSDSGPLWLLGFGGLATGGLILLAAPTVRRRYSAGRR